MQPLAAILGGPTMSARTTGQFQSLARGRKRGQIAKSDLTVEVKTRADDASSLLYAMKRMQQELKSTVAQMKKSSEAISTASKRIASGDADLSQRTEEQVNPLKETASPMEEIASTMKQNAHGVTQANPLAVEGGNVVWASWCKR
jgi:methyl-accepting chemotaxis protein